VKTSDLTTVFKVVSACTNHWKTTSAKGNSEKINIGRMGQVVDREKDSFETSQTCGSTGDGRAEGCVRLEDPKKLTYPHNRP
jgi:hypothetical protein